MGRNDILPNITTQWNADHFSALARGRRGCPGVFAGDEEVGAKTAAPRLKKAHVTSDDDTKITKTTTKTETETERQEYKERQLMEGC